MKNCPSIQPYFYELPPELIAQKPPAQRGQSRLMRLELCSGWRSLHSFEQLPQLLPDGALLVFNDTRVSPARLLGRRLPTGGQAEAFILQPPLPGQPAGTYDLWCLARPGRRLSKGAELLFTHPGSNESLAAELVDTAADGRRLIRFQFKRPPYEVLEALGHIPLPSYIKRPDEAEDRERYQTVYASSPGAVAAPTAGLHFTQALLDRLEAAGFGRVFISLRVSAGTFLPLTEKQLSSGRLHSEFISVSEEAASAVAKARAEGRPVVAVGTTSARALEWASEEGSIRAREGWGDLFIRPGYRFKALDGMISNFHLPGSSLLMLVAALAGRERVLAAYEEAVRVRLRFYSYGDAMLII